MVKCVIISLFKTHNFNFQQWLQYNIISKMIAILAQFECKTLQIHFVSYEG